MLYELYLYGIEFKRTLIACPWSEWTVELEYMKYSGSLNDDRDNLKYEGCLIPGGSEF